LLPGYEQVIKFVGLFDTAFQSADRYELLRLCLIDLCSLAVLEVVKLAALVPKGEHIIGLVKPSVYYSGRRHKVLVSLWNDEFAGKIVEGHLIFDRTQHNIEQVHPAFRVQ